MIRKLLKRLFVACILLTVAGPAWASVTVTFYAHPGARIRGGDLLFPHAYVHAVGTLDDTGEAIDWAGGFTARNPGPALLMMSGRGIVANPDPRYVSEGKPYLRLVVSDDAYRRMRSRAEWWNGRDGWTYNLRSRNCISFVADLARNVGLSTPAEPSMKPGSFLQATANLNPAASVSREAEPDMELGL